MNNKSESEHGFFSNFRNFSFGRKKKKEDDPPVPIPSSSSSSSEASSIPLASPVHPQPSSSVNVSDPPSDPPAPAIAVNNDIIVPTSSVAPPPVSSLPSDSKNNISNVSSSASAPPESVSSSHIKSNDAPNIARIPRSSSLFFGSIANFIGTTFSKIGAGGSGTGKGNIGSGNGSNGTPAVNSNRTPSSSSNSSSSSNLQTPLGSSAPSSRSFLFRFDSGNSFGRSRSASAAQRLLDCGVFSMKGRRPYQEDCSCAILNHNRRAHEAFFAVYDGHGGRSCSSFASEKLHKNLIRSPYYESDPARALIEAFETTDLQFLQQTQRNCDPSGSTACVAFLRGLDLYVANAGDSRAILSCRSGAVSIAMSKDHKPEDPQERQMIIERGGFVLFSMGTFRVQGVLAMSRALGDRDIKEYITCTPDVTHKRLDSDDEFLILGSDGIWDVMTNELAAKLASACDGAEAAAKTLTQAAYHRLSGDNITSICVDLRRYVAAHLAALNPPTPQTPSSSSYSPAASPAVGSSSAAPIPPSLDSEVQQPLQFPIHENRGIGRSLEMHSSSPSSSFLLSRLSASPGRSQSPIPPSPASQQGRQSFSSIDFSISEEPVAFKRSYSDTDLINAQSSRFIEEDLSEKSENDDEADDGDTEIYNDDELIRDSAPESLSPFSSSSNSSRHSSTSASAYASPVIFSIASASSAAPSLSMPFSSNDFVDSIGKREVSVVDDDAVTVLNLSTSGKKSPKP